MEKQRWEESEKRRAEERRSGKRKSEKKEDAGASKVVKHCVFPMICGSGGSKSRLAKAAGAEPCGQMRGENLRAVVARSTFGSQNVQATSESEHFWTLRCDVEKLYALVARRTLGSQNVQTTPCSEHFWTLTLRCRKIARRGGAKHLWKSKCTNHTMLGALLDVEMSKNCTQSRSTFGSQNVQTTPCLEHGR